MKSRSKCSILLAVALVFMYGIVLAGNLDPEGPPSVSDLYQRVNLGTLLTNYTNLSLLII